MYQSPHYLLFRRLCLLIPLIAFCFLPAGTAVAAQATVSWQPNQEPNLAGYRLHYGTQSGNPGNTIDVGSQTSHLLNGLAAGTTYYFTVTAYNDQGVESGYSQEVHWTAPAAAPSLGVTALWPGDYRIAPLQTGDTYFTDRNFKITAMPAGFSGMTAILTANGDKYNNQAELLSFTLHQEATIYVAYDARATRLPAWLTAEFTDTGAIIETTDVTMTLWRKTVAAGNVTLPGNYHGNPAGADSNYFVLVN